MSLGYSGSYASGFPDDLAFEEWLARLETHGRRPPPARRRRARVRARRRHPPYPRIGGRPLRTNREAATLPTKLRPADLHDAAAAWTGRVNSVIARTDRVDVDATTLVRAPGTWFGQPA
jgi:hypothetical protein